MEWFKNDFVDSIKAGWQELNIIPTNVAFLPVRTKAIKQDLKLTLLDKSSGIDREKTANGTEKYLNIKWSFSVKEEFCIAIQLDDVSFTESFML